MKTKKIGEVLRDERRRRQVELEDFAKQTRIRLEYLEALESNRFEELPAATFVKGYIKTYAREFEFDHQPLIALLRRDYKESAKGRLVPREFIKPVLKKQRSSSQLTIVMVVLGAVFFTLVGYVGVQWYNLQQPPRISLVSPEDRQQVAGEVLVQGSTEPDAVVTVNTQPVALQPDGSFSYTVYFEAEGVSTLTVEARDRRGKVSREQRTIYVQF